MRWLPVLALLALAAPARADEDVTKPSYRAVIDRVDYEPASITGDRLRVYLSALAIDGQQLDLTEAKSIKLYLGGGEKKLPYALGTWDGTDGQLAVVVIVQATLDFGDTLPTIAESLDRDLLAGLPDKTTQIAVLAYGDATGSGKLAPVKQLRGKLGALASDGSAGDPALLDTLDRALLMLKKAKTDPDGPIRKVIVVIGDGRDRSGDKERATRLGQRAAKEGVRIHSIAYSPSDARRPLLYLGELSKRSLGTFRWPGRGHHPTPESWSETFKQLRAELAKQYVITYFVGADDDVAGKKLHVVTSGRTETTSNEVKVPGEPTCNGSACDGYCADNKCYVGRQVSHSGALRWILIVAGIAVGMIVLLGLIGYAMSKRQPQQPGVPGAPPAAKPPKPKKVKPGPQVTMPGMLPSGRPIPALLITSGPRAGERFLLRHGFVIGKQPGCDLLIEDGYTSSQHAQVAMDAMGNCMLYDRGSTNGTFMNGVRITEVALEHGAQLRIGATELRFLAQ